MAQLVWTPPTTCLDLRRTHPGLIWIEDDAIRGVPRTSLRGDTPANLQPRRRLLGMTLQLDLGDES